MTIAQFFPMAAACAAALGVIGGTAAAATPAVTALVGGTVVAVDGGLAIKNATVLITGERISQIGPADSADIIAVSADPVKDIHALRTIDFVMKGGAVARDDRRELAAF